MDNRNVTRRCTQQTPRDRRVLIHVGFPKCASTFLKRKVFQRVTRENLMIPRGEVFKAIACAKVSPDDLQRIVYSFARNANEPIILSNEGFCGGGTSETHYLNAARTLNAAFPNARVLIVVREQLSFLQSIYCYRVQLGVETKKFADFLSANEANLLRRLDYSRVVSEYFRLFGSARVTVVPFERICASITDVSREILDAIDADALYAEGNRLRNRSLDDARVISALLRINRIFRPITAVESHLVEYRLRAHHGLRDSTDYPLLQRWVVAAARRVFSGTERIDIRDQVPRSWTRQYSVANDRLSELLQVDLSQFGYLTNDGKETRNSVSQKHEKATQVRCTRSAE